MQRTRAKFACAKLHCQAKILALHQYSFYYLFDKYRHVLNPAKPLIYLKNLSARRSKTYGKPTPTTPATPVIGLTRSLVQNERSVRWLGGGGA
ncbi:MAG: hypothetical protein ACKO2S_06905, partial [Burkholderiaceae bacterium]